MSYSLQPQEYFPPLNSYQVPSNILESRFYPEVPPYRVSMSYPEQVSPCNNVECLQYLMRKHSGIEFSDIFKSYMKLLFMPNVMVKKVLHKILTNAQTTESEASIYDSYYRVNLTETLNSPYYKNSWETADNRFYGEGLPSLVRVIRGGSDPDAIEFIAEVVGVDFTKTNVPQVEKLEGHSFIRESHTYPSDYSSPIVHKLLGRHKNRYSFYNSNGNPSFLLLEWEIKDKPLWLFGTLQQNNHCLINRNVWEFIAPPVEHRIYNKHLIDLYKDREIHIHDDIRNADDSKTSQTVGTWAGDPSFASDLDWSFLKGRKVKYLYNPSKPESYKIGSDLLEAFQSMGIKLHLCEYKRKRFNILIDMVFNIEQLKSRMKTINETKFFSMAKEMHNLDLKARVGEEEEDAPCSISFEKLDAINAKPDFMGEPYFRKGEIAEATAEKGVGKSLFAMSTAFMISSGGSIGQMLSAKKPYKTYFLDAEMAGDDFDRRIKQMIGNFPNRQAVMDNFKYDCLRASKIKKSIDLTKSEDQKWVKGRMGDAKFIVFDNLGKLVPSKALYNEELWNKVSVFFRSLADEGRSILIVHHKNKKGEHKGVGQIENDADVVLYLTKPADCTGEKTIIEISSNKGRNIYGSQRRPFTLEFYNEDDHIKYRIETQDGESDEGRPDSLLTDEEAKRHPIQAAMIKAARKVNQNTALKPEKRFIQKKDIDALHLNRSASSNISQHFKTLCDEKILKKDGYGRGVKYYLYPGPDFSPEA